MAVIIPLYDVPCWWTVLIVVDEVRHRWLTAESYYRLVEVDIMFGWNGGTTDV